MQQHLLDINKGPGSRVGGQEFSGIGEMEMPSDVRIDVEPWRWAADGRAQAGWPTSSAAFFSALVLAAVGVFDRCSLPAPRPGCGETRWSARRGPA